MKNYFREILSLFTQADYSSGAQEEFYRWLTDEENATEKDEALKSLWTEARAKGSKKGLERSLARLRKQTGLPPSAQKHRLHPLRLWQTAAAVLLLLAAGSLYFALRGPRAEADLIQQYTPIAEVSLLTLPDGSRVQLNSGSTLLYPRTFTGKDRSVFLIGEANFKVKPDKKHPFIVKSADLQVTALGTEFNISAYPESPVLAATLLSGSVRVEYDNLRSNLVLRPNEQLVYHKESRKQELTCPDISEVTAWQRGELVFREMTLQEIITLLERKYPYTFIYSLNSLKTDRFSFRFKDKAPLSEVMEVIVHVVGHTSYRIEKDKCYLTRKAGH